MRIKILFDVCIFCLFRYRFRPRVLRDVSKVNLSMQLLGEWVESPVGVAPTGLQKMAHEEGEMATAQGSKSASEIVFSDRKK